MRINPTAPYVCSEDLLFARLKSFAWFYGDLKLASTFQHSAGTALAQVLLHEGRTKPLRIALDCSGLSVLTDHSLDPVKEYLAASLHELVFIRCDAIHAEIMQHLGPAGANSVVDGYRVVAYGPAKIGMDHLVTTCREAALLDNAGIRGIAADAYVRAPGDKLLHLKSTPTLLASGVFDAGSIIGKPAAFVEISTALAQSSDSLLFDLSTTNPPVGDVRVLGVSLRGSPFAAAVASLLPNWTEVDIVDHLGPTPGVWEEYRTAASQAPIEYLVITDFVIGGTELKIAAEYARCRGAKMRGAIAIGSLLTESEYGFGFPLRSLVDLRRCVPALHYEVFGEGRPK